jgi:hypothetical protein
MNKEQFIYWLKGFAAGHEHAPTPKQWETIVSELGKIQDCPDYGSPIDLSNPFPRWQEPHYVNPYKAGKTDTKVTYSTIGTGSNSVVVIDGFIQNASITRANPPSTLTYTTGKPVKYKVNLPKEDNQLDLDL